MSRESLHNLVNRIPEAELSAAQRYLEYLVSDAAYRAALAAPIDDEPVTEGDAAAIRQSLEDVRAGRATAHHEILSEFGLK